MLAGARATEARAVCHVLVTLEVAELAAVEGGREATPVTPSEYQQLIERFDRLEGRHDQLVEFLGRQFTEVDRRFDRLENRFEAFRAEALGHFDEIYRRLERLEQEYYAITESLRRIEALLADEAEGREILQRDVERLKQQVATLQARIAEIEQRLGQ